MPEGRCCAAVRSPQTSPYSFQGLGSEGLAVLQEARTKTGLPIVTELVDPRHVEEVLDAVDVIQIGARNMQNFVLLEEVGRAHKPVLLKRGPSASVEELLMAAEYVAKEGNEQIILCERGIRTFERTTRYTLDLGSVAVLKQETHLPGDRGSLSRGGPPRASCCRSPAQLSRSGLTGSWSRLIPVLRRRCPTARSRSRPPSSPSSRLT